MQENTENNLSINDRIREVLEYLGISRYKFSQATGISEAVLVNIYKDKNKPSVDFIEKTLNKYKVINAQWLITGHGEMLNNNQCNLENIDEIKENKDNSKKTCQLCSEKDKLINSLQAHIDTLQRELHRCQSQLDDYENEAPPGQKRKVG
ncbi:MAG: helix-turn-helix transcriptional regulator [Bacteroidales bacterium]|nr:helix-turn-helix transcriptional regulator [Bacteroidales bacterium]